MPAELHSPPGLRLARYDSAPALEAVKSAVRTGACLPFDALRWAYAAAVQAGLTPRSLLASRDVEAHLDALERLALGPFARRV